MKVCVCCSKEDHRLEEEGDHLQEVEDHHQEEDGHLQVVEDHPGVEALVPALGSGGTIFQ